jgi:inhibitor of cysteine peptidase
MKRVAFIAVALAVLMMGSACDGVVRVTEDDHGSAVELAEGETLVVTLESNRTTGYAWRVREVPDCLDQEGEPEYDTKGSPGMVGAPGEETWRFTAADADDGTLVLEYVRSWEEDEPPASLFELDVDVE